MAETTLIVTGTRRDKLFNSIVVDAASLQSGTVQVISPGASEKPSEAGCDDPGDLQIVSSGRPGKGFDVQIVDPECD